MPDEQYESRKRWNATNYQQINIAVRPELASAFRTACKQAQTSMREAFITLMTQYCATPHAIKEHKDKGYVTRRDRRKATATIIEHLEKIKAAEDNYLQNIPENLQNSSRYESAEQTVELLDNAISALTEAFE